VIDLTQAKQTFAQAVGQSARDRLASLPVCTAKQLKAMGANADIDAFSVTCRPPGINLKQQQKKITQDLATSKEFLGTPKLTAQNLPKNDQGQTVFDKASKAPKVYKWVNASPWILFTLALLTGAGTVLLNESRRRGLRNVAIVTTVIGALLVLGNLGTTQAFNKLNQPNGKLGEVVKGSFQQTIIKALSSIAHSIEQTILFFGIVYLILGVGTLIALKFIKPKQVDKTDSKPTSKDPAPPIDDSPKQKEPDPKSAPKPVNKPTPKPKPIQG
jgi:hypothetical protein